MTTQSWHPDRRSDQPVITYQDLLAKAHEEGLRSVKTTLIQTPSEENGSMAIAKAIVETAKGSFEGLGDASPQSVKGFLTPHLIRMAETRAKARALRDAVNIGAASFEELDGEDLPSGGSSDLGSGAPPSTSGNGTVVPMRRRGRGLAAPKPAFQPMSESQRRYLFRLLSAQGFQGEAAEEHLKDLLEVGSLSDVSKEMASQLIDDLQSRPPRVGHNAERGAPLHR